MKLSKKIKILILLLMCSSIYFIYKATNYHNITYTVMGDSLSLGIDAYGQKVYSYGDYVKEYLIERNKLKTYNNTYTTEDMTIEKLYGTLLTNKKVLNGNKKCSIKDMLHETDYLTISVGLNDLLYKIKLTTDLTENDLDQIIDEIEENFNSLIKEIRRAYNRDIYIIGYYNFDINNNFYKEAIKKLNNVYKSNQEVIYICTYIISDNKNIFLPNPSSYYPNYKGYQVISSKIIDKISKKLEK